MFRFFENLVDPYQPWLQTDTPPRQLWPFLRDYILPFRKVFAFTATVASRIPAGGQCAHPAGAKLGKNQAP